MEAAEREETIWTLLSLQGELMTLGPAPAPLGAAGKQCRHLLNDPNPAPQSSTVIPAASVEGMAPFSLQTQNPRRQNLFQEHLDRMFLPLPDTLLLIAMKTSVCHTSAL